MQVWDQGAGSGDFWCKAPFLACRWPSPYCVLTWPFLSACAFPAPFSSYKDTSLMESGTHPISLILSKSPLWRPCHQMQSHGLSFIRPTSSDLTCLFKGLIQIGYIPRYWDRGFYNNFKRRNGKSLKYLINYYS